MSIILWIGLSGISSLAYRLGGAAKKGDWLDFARDTKTRDFGCPFIILILLWSSGIVNLRLWWLYFISFGLMFAALTTYWDELYKNQDNYWFSGFMVGLALFPLVWAGILWWSILLRAFILAVLWGGWCKIFKNAVVEETGRGAFICLTLPILLV